MLILALLLFVLRLAVVFCKILKRYIINAPAIVLNEIGLWLEDFGLIPWQNVERVEKLVINPLHMASEEVVDLAISFKNAEMVYNKGWLHQRILYLLRNNNSLYHVLVQHLDIDPQEIAQFAKRFIR